LLSITELDSEISYAYKINVWLYDAKTELYLVIAFRWYPVGLHIKLALR